MGQGAATRELGPSQVIDQRYSMFEDNPVKRLFMVVDHMM
jgi:hypothetical protein